MRSPADQDLAAPLAKAAFWPAQPALEMPEVRSNRNSRQHSRTTDTAQPEAFSVIFLPFQFVRHLTAGLSLSRHLRHVMHFLNIPCSGWCRHGPCQSWLEAFVHLRPVPADHALRLNPPTNVAVPRKRHGAHGRCLGTGTKRSRQNETWSPAIAAALRPPRRYSRSRNVKTSATSIL